MSVSIYTGPYGPYQEATENAVYAQDQWTMRKADAEPGRAVRVYDVLIPESHLPAGPCVPARDFPEVKHSPRWENLSPRVGAAYDLFGMADGAQGGAGPVSSSQHGRRREPPGVESGHEHDDCLERCEREFRPRLRSHEPPGQRRVRSVE